MENFNLLQNFREKLFNRKFFSLECFAMAAFLTSLIPILLIVGMESNVVPVNADLELEYTIGRDCIIVYNNSDQYVDVANIVLKLYDDNGKEVVIKKDEIAVGKYTTELVNVSNSIPSDFQTTSFDLVLKSQGVNQLPFNYILVCTVLGILTIICYIFGIKKSKIEKQELLEASLVEKSILSKIKLR